MRNLLLAAVATLLLCSCSAAQREAASCGYNACPKPVPGRYNVHLVPHTHDDVGWLRTVDQYYYYEVQFIIDTVIEELLDNPERKFTYVEMAYFFRWWREQSADKQAKVKQLVKNGQLQFALGGWCMDDEATTHYVDIIDQHTQGLRFLNDTFGDCGRPRVAWQVDPFGHSKEHTAMLAQMGFDGLYYGRIDYQDQALRRKTRRMEMVWQASQDIGSPRADLFSGKLYDGYCQPGGFGFEYGDEPVQDDPQLYDYNVEQKVKQFVDMVNSRRQVYSSDHLMLTMGCDFQYQNARKNFKIYDKLIKAVNARTAAHNITVYYSTPSCYTKSVHDQNLMWTVKSDDFFPYAHQAHAFWTATSLAGRRSSATCEPPRTNSRRSSRRPVWLDCSGRGRSWRPSSICCVRLWELCSITMECLVRRSRWLPMTTHCESRLESTRLTLCCKVRGESHWRQCGILRHVFLQPGKHLLLPIHRLE
ncbi:hypothetical protein BOX15_Mlig003312g1 [Macrostomum lignano]|uniref:Glycoside hydrolase family 38 N-terminal domain-containing protein n=1 Tax=Macrostomum lignano TaxID=282301 RepID=A0A267FI71_9PLAT|nr:hypothetical protein BOX15_Mlig003312g1 [Macrostomum lignano]